MVDEKNKQIESLRKSEAEKERMNNELLQRFESEREQTAKQMQDLVNQLAA